MEFVFTPHDRRAVLGTNSRLQFTIVRSKGCQGRLINSACGSRDDFGADIGLHFKQVLDVLPGEPGDHEATPRNEPNHALAPE
jgi:hypothetical protein